MSPLCVVLKLLLHYTCERAEVCLQSTLNWFTSVDFGNG